MAKKRKKKAVDPQKQAQRRHERSMRKLFERLEFKRLKSDGKQFTFKGRTGEIDDLFLHENIFVLVEYTLGDTTAHLAKKKILYDLIQGNQEDWIKFAIETFAEFSNYFQSQDYIASEYQVRICYASAKAVSDEMEAAASYLNLLNGTTFRYFDSLTKTIHRSAKHEFLTFLKVDFNNIGAEIKKSSHSTKTFPGFVLPESHSSFPKNFKVVSFYADPGTLLTMSYVLRRDSWRDAEGLYQRVLQKGRMKDMRKYLTTEERVFVNNIIVTLPASTKINDASDGTKNVDAKSIKKVTPATIAVPFESNGIGIVDGQHRVFCYHEGNDQYEAQIKKIRDRQNLLVTGVIYPSNYQDADKRRFEAKLFLEINDKQKRTGSELKQSIELILSPYSTIAIAKAVIQKLSVTGALKGLLQTNYFDPPNLIRTTSIVSYGLRPLLKLDGVDSLYAIWDHPQKDKLVNLQISKPDVAEPEKILAEYVEFCVTSINNLLIAAKKIEGNQKWGLPDKAKDRHLSPTIINGFIVCLRRLIEHKKLLSVEAYEKKLQGLASFSWSKYKSSHWKGLGEDLYIKFFA